VLCIGVLGISTLGSMLPREKSRTRLAANARRVIITCRLPWDLHEAPARAGLPHHYTAGVDGPPEQSVGAADKNSVLLRCQGESWCGAKLLA
jgi:hypothetical protein